MCQNEMNLKAVLADLNSEIDVVNSEREYSKQYLELLNITKEQYDEALEKLATLSLVSHYLEELKKWVVSNDARMAENYIQFTVHRIGNLASTGGNNIVVHAQRRILKVFSKYQYRSKSNQ